MPEAAKPVAMLGLIERLDHVRAGLDPARGHRVHVAMLGLIERLDHVRAAGLDPARGHRVHQTRLAQLVREAGRTTVQHVAGYDRMLTAHPRPAAKCDLEDTLAIQPRGRLEPERCGRPF